MPPIAALETPAVTVDLDVLAANIRKMQQYCDGHGIRFRPHVKTHKIPEIARMQREAGVLNRTMRIVRGKRDTIRCRATGPRHLRPWRWR